MGEKPQEKTYRFWRREAMPDSKISTFFDPE
jgi:hypothetical protein